MPALSAFQSLSFSNVSISTSMNSFDENYPPCFNLAKTQQHNFLLRHYSFSSELDIRLGNH